MTLESFTLHEFIGEGSYGQMLLVSHPPSGEPLAMKMVKKRDILESPVNNPLVERQVLEMVGSSPFFTHNYGTFQTEDDVFYVMEYLNGGNLRQRIYKHSPFPVYITRFVLAELLCGLEVMHSKGIVHRDLKPENVLLDQNGHVKIADFGLAKTGMFGNKTARKVVGTPAYRAPEIFCGQRYNRMVDYFALGIMAYEVATGYFPFRLTDNLENMGDSICNKKAILPWGTNANLTDVINRLLCKDKRERQELVSNLRDHPFFRGIDWEEMSAGRATPPPAMRIAPPELPTKRLDMDQVIPPFLRRRRPHWRQRMFRNFSYISDRWRALLNRK
ncbi:protein kinase C theta type-like [Hyperolius riggenbachi]|uniref:protein kinase C theta type-like n=1 Tax=Hyperolius riggenbachi TaxID=752182 RepID=UPI0035A3801A